MWCQISRSWSHTGWNACKPKLLTCATSRHGYSWRARGQIPSDAIDRGWGHLHELHDQLGLLRHFTKYVARVVAAAEAPGLVAEAVRQSLSGRTRPVALECAIDTWGREGSWPRLAPLPVLRPPVDDDAVELGAKLLGNAQRADHRRRRRRARCQRRIAGGGGVAAGAGADVPARARRDSDDASAGGFVPVGIGCGRTPTRCSAVGTRMHLAQTVWGTDAE